MEEFSKAVKVNALSFCKNEVLIIWNWIWQDQMQENEQSRTSSSESEANVQEFDENSDLDNIEVSGDISHSVVFKCIGATKETRIQGVLASASQKNQTW